MSRDIRIVYMGTPDFAVEPLRLLVERGYNVVAVVTVPDRAQGRGQRVIPSSVKKYAVEQGIPVLQPEKMRDEGFLAELTEFNPDLAVVVAFRMLPKEVWAMPRLGTFNLHASLLPDYRGAAPINRAIMDGQKKSGATTFMLDEKIDTGDIIDSFEVDITDDMTAGELHDLLMVSGGELVCSTVDRVAKGDYSPKEQRHITEIHHAPKIFKEDCHIDWSEKADKVYDMIRGLSPYPAAWSELGCEGVSFKIIEARKEVTKPSVAAGELLIEGKVIKVACPDGYIVVNKLQMSGKKAMSSEEFLRGNAKIFDR